MNVAYSNYSARVSLVIVPFFVFGMINGIYNKVLSENSPWLFWTADFLGWIVLPSMILFYIYRYYGIGLHDYGLVKLNTAYKRREMLNWTLISTFILSIYYFAFGWLAWRFIDTPANVFSYGAMVPQGNARYFTIVYFALTAAVFEEIFFRGLIWRLVYSSAIKFNKSIVYVIISSLLFGLVHWENGLPEVISTTIFGVVACILYLRLRNLLPLMIAHFFIDMVNFW